MYPLYIYEEATISIYEKRICAYFMKKKSVFKVDKKYKKTKHSTIKKRGGEKTETKKQ